jgi:hypothetical protein
LISAATQQQPRKLHIWRSQLGAPVDDHHNRIGLFESNLRLS